MTDRVTLSRSLMDLIQAIGNQRNLIGTDFENIQLTEIVGGKFPQQPDGAGLRISFDISCHALGKVNGKKHDALKVLLPDRE